ncbi:MAG TPA: metalloregulator ArsR/SmtB family transcription factor [Streptosporangiales bacterium]
MTSAPTPTPSLDAEAAQTYAAWFACLAEPTRLRLLHTVATAGGEIGVGALSEELGISQPTCSHHLRKLAAVGFVRLRRDGTSTRVSVNEACCSGLPHAADAVMGTVPVGSALAPPHADGVTVRALADDDWPDVRRIYAEGISTGNATFETEVPSRGALDRKWVPGHRWVAEVDGVVAGWAAATPTSARPCYAGVLETSVYVGASHRGRGVGRALLYRQVTAADDDGVWTLQTSIFPENKASLNLHHAAGFRTVGVRDRIAELNGRWRDTVLLERRSPCR